MLGLFAFIKGAIEGREYAKFVFTKSLSDVLVQFRIRFRDTVSKGASA